MAQCRLGVLFVQGIGEQKQGDTLMCCGEPLRDWLARWTEGAQWGDSISLVDTDLRPADGHPARSRLRGELPNGDVVDWLLAESWWAETFRQPNPTAVLRWASGIAGRLAKRQVKRFFQDHERSLRYSWQYVGGQFGLLGRALLGLLLVLTLPAFIAAPLFGWLALAAIRLLVLIAALALVPLAILPPLRPLVRRAQLAMTDALGDSDLLQRNQVSFDAMVSRLVRDLEWLEGQADAVVVVAHAQGSVVAYHALRRRGDATSVRLFLTFGSALRLLFPKDSGETEDQRAARIAWPALRPEGPIAWKDYYAGWDPVPAGPLWARRKSGRTSDPVANVNSVVADHFTYWRNTEQFVSAVANEIARVDKVNVRRLRSGDVATIDAADRQRSARVSALVLARWWYIAAIPAAVLLLMPNRMPDLGAYAFDALRAILVFVLGGLGKRTADLIDGSVGAWVLSFVTVGIGGALLYRLLVVTSWNHWSTRAAHRMFQRKCREPARRERVLFALAMLAPLPALGAIWALWREQTWIDATFGVDVLWAWANAAVIVMLAALVLVLRSPADQRPRALREPSEINTHKTFALPDWVDGKRGSVCCEVRVLSIGNPTASWWRVPIFQAPRGERLWVEVVRPAEPREDGSPPRFAQGDRRWLQGASQLYRWDDYRRWRFTARHDPQVLGVTAEPTPAPSVAPTEPMGG